MNDKRQMEYMLITEDKDFGLIIKENGFDIAQVEGFIEYTIRISPNETPIVDLSKTFEMQIDGIIFQTVFDVAKNYIKHREDDITKQIHEIKKCYRRIERNLNYIKHAETIIKNATAT